MNLSFDKSRREYLTTIGAGAVTVAVGSTSAVNSVVAQEEDWPYGFEWSVESNMPIDMEVTTDLVITYEIDGRNDQTLLVARDLESGTVEWQESFVGMSHGSGLTVGDNAVFAGGGDVFTRIDLETGSREWTYDIEYVSGKPEYYAGSVFVALRVESPHDDLVSLDANTGNVNWRTELRQSTWGSPAIIDDTVYCGTNGYQLSDGEILFEIEHGGHEPRYTTFDDTLILTTWEEEDGQDNMFAIEAGTSSIEWAQNIAGNVFVKPIRVDDTLYIGTRGRLVYSIDIGSGNILWESEELGQISERLAYNNGTIFAATVHGDLYGLNSETGETEWDARVATGGTRVRPLQSLDEDLLISQDYVSGPDDIDGYVIPGSISRLSTDAEPLPSLEITKEPQTPAVGNEIRLRAQIGDVQESTVYWSIWNDDALSENSSAENINLQQDTGTEQTYLPNETGDHSVICVLTDQQRPAITYLSESIEVSNSGSGSPVTVFQQAKNVADSLLAVTGLGAVAVGLGYTVYQRIRSDSTKSSSTAETQQTLETSSDTTINAESVVSKTIDSYSKITIENEIESKFSVSIHEGTVENDSVWAITPDTSETISSEQATKFVEIITPWSQVDPHAHLILVYGSGTDPLPWAAIEQADYAQLTDEVNRLSIDETCDALQAVCEALHHVYRYGTTYENLTTESVLYTDDDEVKLWGILDQFEEPDPWYNAPEEFDSESTERSTVYRIGVITYELLTGTLPYKTYPNGSASGAIQSAERSTLSEQVDNIPIDLESVVMKALSRSPENRYETVLHLRDEFEDSIQ